MRKIHNSCSVYPKAFKFYQQQGNFMFYNFGINPEAKKLVKMVEIFIYCFSDLAVFSAG
jgi:hypothetical protein